MIDRHAFSTVLSFQVAPAKVTLDDLDDLINALSPDELKELSLVDPDVSQLDPWRDENYRA